MKYSNNTDKLRSVENCVKFEIAVNLLNEIELDGETAEYLLRLINNDEQVFGQILRDKVYGKEFPDAVEELLKSF